MTLAKALQVRMKKSAIAGALLHPDVPGALRTRLQQLSLSPQDIFDTVMAEYERGTLRDDDGNLVVDYSRAQQLAYNMMYGG